MAVATSPTARSVVCGLQATPRRQHESKYTETEWRVRRRE